MAFTEYAKVKNVLIANTKWGLKIKYINDKWCMTKDGVTYYDAPTKEVLIEAYCNHDMQEYTYPDDIKCECGNRHF